MTIQKPVSRNEDNFIKGAPDSGSSTDSTTKGVMRGNKRQISLTLAPGMLPLIDMAADELGISRAAWISMTISKALKAGGQ